MLRAIPELAVTTAPEAELCCGSAGIYNLVQPDAAEALGARKMEGLRQVSADVVATGNAGCLLQLAAAARAAGRPIRVVHPIQILDASIRGTGL
jgi:glycolate oxidase iron-sulfur subunit